MTLVEFLTARLDEYEQIAQAAADAFLWGDRIGMPSLHPSVRRHVYSWTSGRVLDEIKAKRLIIEEHTCDCPDPECHDCGACSGKHHADPTASPCRTLRLLALPYAEHDDYHEVWRP